MKVLRWAIPILLIVLISFDLFKALTGEVDDKAKKDAISKSVKRLLYALIIFLIPTIVNLVLKNVAPAAENPSGWYGCWTHYYNE